MMAETTPTSPTALRPPGKPVAARLSSWLGAMPLHRRFALVGSLVMLAGMAVIGHWVADEIEKGVVRNSAISSAVYMESFIAPLSQELAEKRALSPATIDRLNQLLQTEPLRERIVSVKIWRPGGFLAFSSDADMIGRTFQPGADLKRAWAGELTASFDELDEAENARERATGRPLLEVYNPIHSILTGEVIAVAEFYQDASELEADLRTARTRSWAVVAAVALTTFAALFGIVRAGSRTIARQTGELTRQLAELARVSAQNDALRRRVQAASRRASETNERYMRRISAELHDGPAQALALASLRLDSLLRRASLAPDDPEGTELRQTLAEALRDVRDLCRGLTLPELEGRSLAETLDLAVGAHERRTGGSVDRRFASAPGLDVPAPHPILICLYRFVQEGLMNAYRHAGGKGQRVDCRIESGRLVVSVIDDGPGFEPGRPGGGLGLAGLRERAESIGGEFRIDSAPGAGTRLTMALGPEPAA